MPYQPSNNIANLLMRQGQIESQRQLQTGEAYGRMGAQLGQIASSTLGDLMKYKADEPRRKAEAAQFADQERERTGKKFLNDAVMTYTDKTTGVVDHKGVAGFMTDNGFPDVAQAYTDQAKARYDKTLQQASDSISKQGSVYSGLLEIANQAAANPANYETHYRQAAVDLYSKIGGDPKDVPLKWDAETFAPMMAKLEAKAQEFQAHEFQLKMIQAARAEKEGSIKADQLESAAINSAIGQTTDQASLDQALINLEKVGVDKGKLQQYGRTWSPEVKQAAIERQLSPDKIAELTQKRTEGLQGFLNTARAEAEAAGKPFGSQEILINTTAYESAGKGDSFDRALARIYPGKVPSKEETLAFRKAWEQAGHFNDSAAAATAAGDYRFTDFIKDKNAERARQNPPLPPLTSDEKIELRGKYNLTSSRTGTTASTDAQMRREYQDYLAQVRLENAALGQQDQPLTVPLSRKAWQQQEYGTAAPPEEAGPNEKGARGPVVPTGDLAAVANPTAGPPVPPVVPPPPAAPPPGPPGPSMGDRFRDIRDVALEGLVPLPGKPVMPPPPPAPPPARVPAPAGAVNPGDAALRQQVAQLLVGVHQAPTERNIDAFLADPRNRAELARRGLLPSPSRAPVATTGPRR